MYYVEENHSAIIDKEMWEAVQLEMQRRRVFAKQHSLQRYNYDSADNPFSERVICGGCGSTFGRRTMKNSEEKFGCAVISIK